MKNVAQSLDRRERGWEGGGAAAWGRGTAGPQPRGGRKPAPVCGSRPLGTLPANRGHCQQARGSVRVPLPAPPCLLCTRTSAKQKQLEVGPRLSDDPRANRKTALASWTIYGGCLKHRCFGDAKYSEYSSEESVLCTRRVLC